jgi:hypothetical protein
MTVRTQTPSSIPTLGLRLASLALQKTFCSTLEIAGVPRVVPTVAGWQQTMVLSQFSTAPVPPPGAYEGKYQSPY